VRITKTNTSSILLCKFLQLLAPRTSIVLVGTLTSIVLECKNQSSYVGGQGSIASFERPNQLRIPMVPVQGSVGIGHQDEIDELVMAGWDTTSG